ncbi:MAG: hypothetical protein WCP59_15360 [Actinomycetota bacterium]
MDDRRPPRVLPWIVLAALAGLSLGALFWSLSANLEGTPYSADYYLRPNEGLVRQRWLVFVVACLVGLAVTLMAWRLRRRGAVPEVGIVLPVMLAGGFLGVLYATMTAPVVGANIGAGLALMATPFVLGALGVWFVVSLRRHRTI